MNEGYFPNNAGAAGRLRELNFLRKVSPPTFKFADVCEEHLARVKAMAQKRDRAVSAMM